MANWISSKLKAAESILQQIDQQAAESLRKNEDQRSDDLRFQTPTKISGIVPLKDQLKKKVPENNDSVGKLRGDRDFGILNHNSNHSYSGGGAKGVASVSVNPNAKSSRSLSGNDWTELLSSPNKKNSSPLGVNSTGGLPGIKSLRKDGRRKGGSGSHFPELEGGRNQKNQNNVLKSFKNSEVRLEIKSKDGRVDGSPNNGEDSTPRTSSVELQSDVENLDRIGKKKTERKDGNDNTVVEKKTEANSDRNDGFLKTGNGMLFAKDSLSDENFLSTIENSSSLSAAAVDVVSTVNMEDKEDKKFKSGTMRKDKCGDVEKSSPITKKNDSSGSDDVSDSETDSNSSSDSESVHEREERRKRMEQLLAQRAAAKAIEAIKERENMVARLEGEKQSLEKILEERAKQQAEEASELQTSMMETMEAVEMEKQKHNHTRMEALARLAQLETENADLAKALANAQWNLEVEVNRIMELRQQMELKDAAHEELRRKISRIQWTGNKQLEASKGVEFEREILEAEYSFMSEKVGRLQEQAKTLERSIEMTQKDMENPTEVEVELKRRLNQLTDHLIQKQAQVEALSSEKATILFRIEAVSRSLDENKSVDYSNSSKNDLETGKWDYHNLKLRPMFEQKIRSGQQHLGSLVKQLDSIFCAGDVFLRRNSTARMWSLVYIVCLHIWVLYILMSHTPVSDESRSGAVFSLENINKTGGV